MLNLLFASWLVFTLPATGQRVWSDPTQGVDSTMVECSGGPQIHSLQSVELWGWPVTGGGFRLISSKPAVGMEGLPDSFPVPWPGLFYVLARNNVGPSCASNSVTVAPDVLTGVGTPDETLGEIILADLFDVQGRRVASFQGLAWPVRELRERMTRIVAGRRSPSGVYFVRGATGGGATYLRRVVLIR